MRLQGLTKYPNFVTSDLHATAVKSWRCDRRLGLHALMGIIFILPLQPLESLCAQELKCWIFDIYLFDWFDAIGTNAMYMHPYIRLYGASVLLFKIEYTVKKLKSS